MSSTKFKTHKVEIRPLSNKRDLFFLKVLFGVDGCSMCLQSHTPKELGNTVFFVVFPFVIVFAPRGVHTTDVSIRLLDASFVNGEIGFLQKIREITYKYVG